MKIVITGGHFAPAAAVIERLKSDEVLMIGRRFALEGERVESLEYAYCQKNNIRFEGINTGRLQRKFTRYTISSLVKFPKSIIIARRLLEDFKPDMVLVFGGYVALPVALAARTLGIPVVVHEQTLGAGKANKFIGKFATRICISFETSAKYFPKDKTVVTGNPIRTSVFIVETKQPVDLGVPIIYVTGGSTGSHAINILVEKSLLSLLKEYSVIHQTGETREYQDYERLLKNREKFPENLKKRYVLKKYVEGKEIGWIYKNADVVVGRAGINTVCEILAVGKSALLIPLPHGQKNEQLENAKFYKSTGLGAYIEQDKVNNTLFEAEIRKLQETQISKDVLGKAQSLVRKDAGENIVKILKELYEKR